MSYRRRVIDDVLDEALPDLPAVALEGAKGVGKTATAARRATTILSLDDPRNRASVAANFDLVADVDRPVFIDEWQLEPQVWDRVRRAVDAQPDRGGQFLLAGSADVAPGVRIHSGAGRIVSLVMRPMTLSERGIEEPTVSLRAIAAGESRIRGTTTIRMSDYVDEILRSGFPGIRDLPPRNRERQLDGYLSRIVDRDMPENGIRVRRPASLRAWLRAYAAATASTADYTTILDAATAGSPDKPARSTVDIYREHLLRMFVLDPVEAWTPAFAPLKRLTYSPKHHLVDPALAARVVGVGASGLLVGEGETASPSTGTWLGALFESLAVQSVRVYADAMGARVGHLRTKSGDHEVDIIVERDDARCVAFEVKLADTVRDDDVRHLRWLRAQLGERLIDAAVLHTGRHAYRRPDGIAVVPLALLGP
ncbi:MAG: AAA family ATPase [Actinobacteria bacterium 69-20]|jgi:predicted AAA+ superfamily ATPase|nr:ATP-binding protein [Actinomycetota bacterium]OJV25159.1 MAG: AAA family ATPase [Actinobacteria bacterium 69-20]